MLRHARSTANELAVWSGQTDPELSERGVRELLELRSLGEYPRCGLYFSSPLARCTATLEMVYERKADHFLPEFRECGLGALEGEKYTSLDDDVNYLSWINEPNARHRGGESFSQFTARVRSGFTRMAEICAAARVQSAAAVLHGNVMRAILHGFVDPSRPHHSWEIPNCGGYLFDFEKALRPPLAYQTLPSSLFSGQRAARCVEDR